MIRLLLAFLFLSQASMTQTVQQLSFKELQKKIVTMNDTIVVLNFWATWCKPCIEELPGLEQLNRKYSSKKVKVILVNLDFNSKINSLVEPFVKRNNLASEILHITDSDPNTWINSIDSTWSGAVPATAIYDSSHHKIKFHEGQLTFEELEKIILPYLAQ